MDIGNVLKLKGMWDSFVANHPMFPRFINAMRAKGIQEGTIIDITITDPQGNPVSTNIKVNSQDMELFELLMNMKQ